MTEPREENDALEDELRGFTPAGPLEGLRERVLGEEQPAVGEGELEAELGGFSLPAPPAALRERILGTVELLETRGQSRRAIGLQLAAILVLAALAWAANAAVARSTSGALNARQRSAGERGDERLLRLPPSDTGLRRRAQKHLSLNPRKG